MNKALQNQKIALLAANGVTEYHMTEIQKDLMKSGAFLRIISCDHAIINSWNGNNWGVNFAVDAALSSALGVDYDMLVIPGGARSVEKLQRTAHTKRFISSFARLSKPIAAIEEGKDLLEASGVETTKENVILIEESDLSVLVTELLDAVPEMQEAA